MRTKIITDNGINCQGRVAFVHKLEIENLPEKRFFTGRLVALAFFRQGNQSGWRMAMRAHPHPIEQFKVLARHAGRAVHPFRKHKNQHRHNSSDVKDLAHQVL